MGIGRTGPRDSCLDILSITYFKGTLRRFEEHIWSQNVYICGINELIIQTRKYFFVHKWTNKLFPEENKVPMTLF